MMYKVQSSQSTRYALACGGWNGKRIFHRPWLTQPSDTLLCHSSNRQAVSRMSPWPLLKLPSLSTLCGSHMCLKSGGSEAQPHLHHGAMIWPNSSQDGSQKESHQLSTLFGLCNTLDPAWHIQQWPFPKYGGQCLGHSAPCCS